MVDIEIWEKRILKKKIFKKIRNWENRTIKKEDIKRKRQ